MFQDLEDGEVFTVFLYKGEHPGMILREKTGEEAEMLAVFQIDGGEENKFNLGVSLAQIRLNFGLIAEALAQTGRKVRFEIVEQMNASRYVRYEVIFEEEA